MQAVATTLSTLGLYGGALHAVTADAAATPSCRATLKSLSLPRTSEDRAELIAAGAFPALPPPRTSAVSRDEA